MNYWTDRKEMQYYKTIKEFAESCGEGDSVCDIGSAGTPVAMYGNFKKRIRIDERELPGIDGAKTIKTDWMDYELRGKFTLAICSQVLEHLENEKISRFVDKVFDSADNIIISVPYLWHSGLCAGHCQDPINLHKFCRLVGYRNPDQIRIVIENNGCKRIVAIFSHKRKSHANNK